jgi:hypothetical protein
MSDKLGIGILLSPDDISHHSQSSVLMPIAEDSKKKNSIHRRSKDDASERALREAQMNDSQLFFSELANRWRCSRGSVYNWLRASGAFVVDFAARGRRGRKAVPLAVVLQIEAKKMRRL